MECVNKQLNNKGYSIQSVVIGFVILGVLSTTAVYNLWPEAQKTKTGVLATYIQEQQGYLSAELNRGHSFLEALNNPVSGGDAKTQDYLGDLVSNARISALPTQLFNEPAALTWEIRSLSRGGGVRAYYIHINSTNTEDQEMIQDAIDSLNIPVGAIQ